MVGSFAKCFLSKLFSNKVVSEGKEETSLPLATHLRARIPTHRLPNARLSIPRISRHGREVPAHPALHAREEDASVQEHSQV